MNAIKKILAILLAVLMMVCTVACAPTTENNNNNNTPATTEPQTTTEPQETTEPAEKCVHCDQVVTWVPLSTQTLIPSAEGHYYLAEDIQLLSEVVVADVDMVIDLNGHTITAASGVRAIRTNTPDTTLSILDSVGGGKIESNVDAATAAVQGCVLYVLKGTINLYSGTVVSHATEGREHKGGVIRVGNSSARIGYFNMYGGTIQGGKAMQGGNIYVNAYSSFTMEGGTITGGSSDQGTNIYCDALSDGGTAIVNLNGGTVTGGILLENASVEATVTVGANFVNTGVDGGYTMQTGTPAA